MVSHRISRVFTRVSAVLLTSIPMRSSDLPRDSRFQRPSARFHLGCRGEPRGPHQPGKPKDPVITPPDPRVSRELGYISCYSSTSLAGDSTGSRWSCLNRLGGVRDEMRCFMLNVAACGRKEDEERRYSRRNKSVRVYACTTVLRYTHIYDYED